LKHEKFKYKKAEKLLKKAEELNLQLPYSEDIEILFEPISISGKKLPNRLVVQPMEGFDSNINGSPGEFTYRRYKRFAEGGSGMIWFEATSINQEGRSNPHQLLLNKNTIGDFQSLVEKTKNAALKSFGKLHEPFLVLQLTHSGRFSKPEGKSTGKVFYNNPYLDKNKNSIVLYNDEEINQIKQDYQEAIKLAQQAGFDAVDIKACHGYLLHEMLSAYNRADSIYGGNFKNRVRLLTDLALNNRESILAIRLNAVDFIPYPYGFGMKKDGSMRTDIEEPKKLIKHLVDIGYELINITAGIPYYNPYIGRPFDRPLKGSHMPDEHPLEGIMRLILITEQLQKNFPEIPFVGSGYSWLRQYFPNVGAGVIKNNMASLIGLGRSSIAYPDAPKHLMEKTVIDPERFCISCSRCTELMRFNLNSGCVIHDKEIYGKNYRKIKFKR